MLPCNQERRRSSFRPRGASPVSPTQAINELSCSCFSVDGRRRCLTISLSMTLSVSLVEVVATSFTERSLDEVDPWSGDQNPWAHMPPCCARHSPTTLGPPGGGEPRRVYKETSGRRTTIFTPRPYTSPLFKGTNSLRTACIYETATHNNAHIPFALDAGTDRIVSYHGRGIKPPSREGLRDY